MGFHIATVVICWVCIIADWVMIVLLNRARHNYEDALEKLPSEEEMEIRPVIYVDADTGRHFLEARTLATLSPESSTCRVSVGYSRAYWLDELPTREVSSAKFQFAKSARHDCENQQ